MRAMLTSLVVQNFRSLHEFSVPRLGRVNLIVGKNNAGKSTVLEAIRIFAGNANRVLLDEISESHDEVLRSRDAETTSDGSTRPYEDFFTGRQFSEQEGLKIVIGDPSNPEKLLSIEHVFVEMIEDTALGDSGEPERIVRRRVVPKAEISTSGADSIRQAISVQRGDKSVLTFLDSPRLRSTLPDLSDASKCGMVPTRFISMNELARDWDRIALTEHEEIVRNAIRHIAPDFEGITFVEGPARLISGRRETSRTARVKLSGAAKPVPLSSLGDGILRVFQMTLRAFSARDGYLLIDEFENGLHYSIQDEIWATVFDLAGSLNMQIFATTHSWDCIQSFSRVAQNRKDIKGVLFRVGRSARQSDRGKIISTVFADEKLCDITQDQLEVR
jgi:ABC-type cobalamin/Fe3+-siderophores transport system ATPase subunit